jgi:hypothetical protein
MRQMTESGAGMSPVLKRPPSSARSVDHVSAKGAWDGERIRLDDRRTMEKALAGMKLSAGEGVVVTVMREEEAVRVHQYKYWHGYVLEPLVEYTGDQDYRLELKARFMPAEKVSLTQLTYTEMKRFIEESEAWARTMCPEAYEQFGREYLG